MVGDWSDGVSLPLCLWPYKRSSLPPDFTFELLKYSVPKLHRNNSVQQGSSLDLWAFTTSYIEPHLPSYLISSSTYTSFTRTHIFHHLPAMLSIYERRDSAIENARWTFSQDSTPAQSKHGGASDALPALHRCLNQNGEGIPKSTGIRNWIAKAVARFLHSLGSCFGLEDDEDEDFWSRPVRPRIKWDSDERYYSDVASLADQAAPESEETPLSSPTLKPDGGINLTSAERRYGTIQRADRGPAKNKAVRQRTFRQPSYYRRLCPYELQRRLEALQRSLELGA